MKITVDLDLDQAEALLTVLGRIGPSDIAMLHEGVEWPAFDKARTALHLALRDLIEPGRRERGE